jgi:hypothetical protein
MLSTINARSNSSYVEKINKSKERLPVQHTIYFWDSLPYKAETKSR